jgi:transposase-like protein
VPYKDRRAVTADLKEICLAPSEEAAAGALERFAGKWDAKYPGISRSWRNRWAEIIPYMKFSPEIRRTYGSLAIYTANAIESVNYTLQRNLKTRQSFPNDESAMKLIYMILQRISKRWTMPIRNWGEALHQFSLIYGDRVPL